MGALKNPLPILNPKASGAGSQDVIAREAANEFVFAVVGHAGSGTSAVAQSLGSLLGETKINGSPFDVIVLKAREVIQEWAKALGKPIPPNTGKRLLADVRVLQDYGDEMRSQIVGAGPDHAAVARGLITLVRRVRAEKTNSPFSEGKPVDPDGAPRAYILDSLRHPAEVQLLRQVYGDAFVLIGVVCEEEKRKQRLQAKYEDGGKKNAEAFMKRDADDDKKHGQHVADAFHLADFFVDNTVDRKNPDDSSNKDWDVVENLSRLVKIVTHSELIRPRLPETAMYHAFSAQMQSACLSRQVGAALVDTNGTIVATGTNEVPRAGGGVYGESIAADVNEARCAMFEDSGERFCRNTRQQNAIIDELFDEIPELGKVDAPRRDELKQELRRTRIGGLLEFSRAVHAEMDALLSAARKGVSLVGTRLFVTTFPCHYCARHLVTAGVDEVQYIEPYPKSQALSLHKDAIAIVRTGWKPPSEGGDKVLFRPFSGIAPSMYKRAFLKDRELKDKSSGDMSIQPPGWVSPWHLPKVSYTEIEARLESIGK